jgi:hypothetical protein
VAVLSPVIDEAEGLLSGDALASIDDYRRSATVFEIEPRDLTAYRRVYREVAPMRDFQGDTSGWVRQPDPVFREMLELDNPLTRPIVCRRRAEVEPWLGTFVTFGAEKLGSNPRVVTNLECLDVAYAGMIARERRAIAILKRATGSDAEIKSEEERDHPECRDDPLQCYGPIL